MNGGMGWDGMGTVVEPWHGMAWHGCEYLVIRFARISRHDAPPGRARTSHSVFRRVTGDG